ncbi:HdeA/HdeB family chaperone [Pseudomonas putida]|uniref:HdeA/HdeB family chaperone n=1 Tax=Pseudomonas putida TaxID=303 RepID=UPI001049D049|nr:HdeA/HdeB family chaperone [Pseudomonas putida]
MRFVAMALLLCVGAADAQAAVNGRFRQLGIGTMGCGEFVRAANDNIIQDAVGIWLSGYFTAYNNVTDGTDDVTKKTGPDDWTLWIQRWCKQNPLNNVGSGAEALLMTLRADATHLPSAHKGR